ncbi:Cilia- and flagella-associated protein 20/CFAP20DC like protein, partial [Aduncisulcus paluster]
MYKSVGPKSFIDCLYAIGSKPLFDWGTHVQSGHIKRITDPDIQACVIEIMSPNVNTCYITHPDDPKQTLGIKLPVIVLLVKNLKKQFSFEVTILDDRGVKRRLRSSTYQPKTRVKPFICTMPLRLDDGWNTISCNLLDYT